MLQHPHKNRLLLLSCLVCLNFLFVACKKEENNKPKDDAVTVGTIKGSVLLPAGSNQDVNTFSVHSAIEKSGVTGGTYELDTYTSSYTTQLVENTNGEVVMMGYYYPGQTDHAITVQTTALALIMNARTALFLSSEGKLQLMKKVLKAPAFPSLEAVVEANIKAGTPLFDLNNTTLQQVAAEVFQYAASRVTDALAEPPVIINKIGKTVYFSNAGKAHSVVVGIYQNGARVKKIVVDGLQSFPNSISETLDGYGEITEDPVVQDFTLGSGNYEIKMRTGRPGADDGSLEHREALLENVALNSYYLLSALMPALEPKGCSKKVILATILNGLSGLTEVHTSKSMGAAIYAGEAAILLSLNEFASNCNTPFNPDYFKKYLSPWKFIDKAFSLVGGIGNLGRLSLHWAKTEPAFDDCFTVQGNKIVSCYPIKLIATGKTSAAPAPGCVGRSLDVYYLNLKFEDPNGLFDPLITNIVVSSSLDDPNACWDGWRKSDLWNANSFSNNYPIKIENGTVSVAAGMSNYSDKSFIWVEFQDYMQTQRPLSNRLEYRF